MKAKIKIEEIGHNDLVNLFADALYENAWHINAEYDKARYSHYVNEGDSFEDTLARIILNDGKVTFGSYDNSSETWLEVDIKYNDIKRGLENAANGNFVADDETKEHIKHVIIAMTTNFDIDTAEAFEIMQIILFNEVF